MTARARKPLQIYQVPLDELAPWARNPKAIDPQQLEHLKSRMTAAADMLQVRPVIVLAVDAGEIPAGTVIAGNHRILAARELGWQKIPAAYVELDENTAREWSVIDNNPYAAYVEDKLADLLREMEAAGSELESLGFAQGELDRLLADAGGGEGAGDDTDPMDPPADPITRPGDLIHLGPHRLLCGDSSDPLALDRVYQGVAVACVLTDPPYGIDVVLDINGMPAPKSKAERGQIFKERRPTKSGKGALGDTPARQYRPIAGDDQPFDAAFLTAYFAGVREQFWFGANYYRRTLSDSDMDGSWLVWDKRNEDSDAGFGSGFELCWSRTPHKQDLLRHFWFGALGGGAASAEAKARVHPTQKPTPLLAEILDRWAPAECIVADPFLGSGATLIACENTGRSCHGLELDAAYCDVIVDRWERHTGQTAQRMEPRADD